MTPLNRPCKECGHTLYQHPGKVAPEFCSKTCRDAFANRRKSRGAQLIDIAMMNYIDRSHPMRKSGELRLAMDRLLATWRDEDRAVGRASYMDVTALIDCGTHIDPRRERSATGVRATQ